MDFDSKIDRKDRLVILLRTGIKALRGLWKRIFIKEVHGLFLVGAHVTYLMLVIFVAAGTLNLRITQKCMVSACTD